MSKQGIDPKTFFQSPDAVAVVIDPEELFGLLTRSFELGPGQAALVGRERGDRIVCAPGSSVSAEGVTEVMLVRTTPVAVSLDGITVSSLDEYQCAAAVSFRVSLIAEASELHSFQKAIVGSAQVARTAALQAHFEPYVLRSLAEIAEGRGVEVLISPSNAGTLSAEMADGLKRAAFSCGLRIEKPVDVRFDSAVYRQVVRSRADARRRQEEFAANRRIEMAVETARQEHSQKLAELLDEMKSLADRSPDHDLGDLVRTFSEVDRGPLYAALFAADGARAVTERIVVASGRELLFFDPASLDTPVTRVSMPESIGPVRSVQMHLDAGNERRLFVGAAHGLHELDVEGSGDVVTYVADSGDRVQGGVNSVALAGDQVFASHSELGVLYWRRGGSGPAGRLMHDQTKNAKAVRCVRFLNGAVYFSIDERVIRMAADRLDQEPVGFRGSRSLISALCPTGDGVYAGNAEGEVLYWPAGETGQPEILHSGRQRSAESVVVLDFGGLRRLFYTETSLAVFARVIGDTFICRYEAGGQTLRRVEVAPDVIVATNEVRDRLICWRPGQPDAPYGVASVSQLTSHSIQDVCLIPAV
ncbi:MAG: SPFH domain-containing protein [Phycisphaerae bacterium]